MDQVQTLHTFRFDPALDSWVTAPPEPDARQERLRLVTYNIWFGEFRWRERFGALMDLLRACRPDVVALQEVTPRHLEDISAAPWVRRDYRLSDAVGGTLEPHGVLILSRLPLRALALCDLPSDKARKLLVAELGLTPGPLHVGSLHLESSARATPLRLRQLDIVRDSVAGMRHVVLLGDFNFDPKQEVEQSQLEPHFRDLWGELRGDEPGFTQDTDNNPMRLRHKGEHRRVRFDRILLRSSVPGWEPQAVRLVGTQPVSSDWPDVYPSDHFGLCGEMVWRGARTTEGG